MAILPTRLVPTAKMLAKGGFTTMSAPAELMPIGETTALAVAETASHKAVFDENDPNRMLVKNLSKAGLVKKDPREQLAEIDARLAAQGGGPPPPALRASSMLDGVRYEVDPDGSRWMIVSEGSDDGLPPIRIAAGTADPAEPSVSYASSDGFAPIEIVVESSDPLTKEVGNTHPGAVLANLARHAHKAGRADINHALMTHMQAHPDMHKRVAPEASGVKHVHYRTAATPHLDAHVAKHGIAKTLTHVRELAKTVAPRVHDGLDQPLESAPGVTSAKPKSFSETIGRRLANPTPTNEGTTMTASFKDRLSGAPNRIGTKPPAAVAPVAATEHKDLKSKLDALVAEAVSTKADAALIEALKAARALIPESIPANVVVDVTYTPAATEEESRGIVQQLIEFALRCGAMGWTQEGGLQAGKLELNFRNMPFVHEFGKQAKMSKAYTGMSVRADKGSTVITAAPATPVPAARNVA